MMNASISQVVPKATFVDDISDFVKDRQVEDVLREVRATLGKYKHVEQEVVQRMHRLEVKEPEIQKCLDAVNMLIEKRDGDGDETILDFSLSDHLYARAKIDNYDSVGIWLGAGVMVEYSLDDAKELLEKQMNGCTEQLKGLRADYDYVKDQLTTTEVFYARMYNYSVSQRKK